MGPDAAISWTSPDLVFYNDTGNWILITASYDDENITVKIWGTSQHRSVTSEDTGLELNSNGTYSITNYRTVYDENGNVLWRDTFYSGYSKING